MDEEKKVICPYNPSHYILARRLNTHLVKCRKDYPNTPLVACDFNVTHRIRQPELQYHYENCPDRKKIEMVVYQEEGTDIDKFPVNNIEVPNEENWDNEFVETYVPEAYCEKREIIRRQDVTSASQRKNFRQQERLRINQISSDPQRKPKDENRAGTSNNDFSRNAPSQQANELMKQINLGKPRYT